MIAPIDSSSFKFEFALTHRVESIVYLDRIEGYISYECKLVVVRIIVDAP